MVQEVIRLSPDALGYKDRGKMKWMGMMLSDHAEALKKEKQMTLSKDILPKKRLSVEELSTLLYQSYIRKKPVAIQLDIIKDGRYLPDVEGFILGFKEKTIFIKQRDYNVRRLNLEDIRHVEWIDAAVWFEKYERQTSSD